jgi:hypothetical protein
MGDCVIGIDGACWVHLDYGAQFAGFFDVLSFLYFYFGASLHARTFGIVLASFLYLLLSAVNHRDLL